MKILVQHDVKIAVPEDFIEETQSSAAEAQSAIECAIDMLESFEKSEDDGSIRLTQLQVKSLSILLESALTDASEANRLSEQMALAMLHERFTK